MPKRLILKPSDWEMPLEECPPGLFVWIYNDIKYVGFKSEYGPPDNVFNSAGEIFWGLARNIEERNKCLVIPLMYEEEEI